MSGIIVKLLREHAGEAGASDRAGLIDGLLAEAEVLHCQNAAWSAALQKRLAGNHALTLSEQPDGYGCFYGWLNDDNGNQYRVDVLPPQAAWCGDLNNEAAHATHWVVFLDGEENHRAETIEGLSGLTLGEDHEQT